MSDISLENQLLKAVDIVVTGGLDRLELDKTILAVVEEKPLNRFTGEHTVRYQDSSFKAYSTNPNLYYEPGTMVYVQIPKNDFSEKKIITGGKSTVPGDILASNLFYGDTTTINGGNIQTGTIDAGAITLGARNATLTGKFMENYSNATTINNGHLWYEGGTVTVPGNLGWTDQIGPFTVASGDKCTSPAIDSIYWVYVQIPGTTSNNIFTPDIDSPAIIQTALSVPADTAEYKNIKLGIWQTGADKKGVLALSLGQTYINGGEIITGTITIGKVDSTISDPLAAGAVAEANAKNEVALKLGYSSYADMVAKAAAGQTIIDGGYLRTDLIEAGTIVANQLHVLAKNLVNNPSATHTLEGWSIYNVGTGTLTLNNITLGGTTQKALCLTSNNDSAVTGNLLVWSDPIPVDPLKSYKVNFGMWGNNTGAMVYRYAGIYCYDKNDNRIATGIFSHLTKSFLDDSDNNYFKIIATDNGLSYQNYQGFVLAAGSVEADFPSALNVDKSFRLPYNASYIRLRFLNYRNSLVTETAPNLYIYSPTITEIGSARIYADSIEAGTINAAVEMTSPIIRSTKTGVDDTATGFYLSSSGLSIGTSTKYLKYKIGTGLSIEGGDISGGTFKTSLTGDRIEIVAGTDTSKIKFYRDGSTVAGSVGLNLTATGSDLGSLILNSAAPTSGLPSKLELKPCNTTLTHSGSLILSISGRDTTVTPNVTRTRYLTLAATNQDPDYFHPMLALGGAPFTGVGTMTTGVVLKGLISSSGYLQIRNAQDTEYGDIAADKHVYCAASNTVGNAIIVKQLYNTTYGTSGILLVRTSADDGYAPLYCHTLYEVSDPKVKKNIQSYKEVSSSALEKVKKTRVVSYNLKDQLDTDKKTVGWLNTEMPEEAKDLEGGGYNPSAMLAILWRSVQELSDEVTALKERSL